MAADEPLVAVFMPALVEVLAHEEANKGEPLTEEEVLAIRDQAVSITLKYSQAQAMESKRGYPDIDPDNVWKEWQAVRSEMMPGHEEAGE
jgi:hypothetical protein